MRVGPACVHMCEWMRYSADLSLIEFDYVQFYRE